MTETPEPTGGDGGPFSLRKDSSSAGQDPEPQAWSATPPEWQASPGSQWQATPESQWQDTPGSQWQDTPPQGAPSYDPSQYGTPQYGQQAYPGQGYDAPQGPPPPGYYGQQPYGSQPQGHPGYPQVGGYAVPGFAGIADPWAPYGRDPATGTPLSDKSKTSAGLLQLFLGGFGAGRFYLGHNGIAIAQLVTLIVGWVLTIFLVGIFVLLALGIWTLVDAIMMFSGGVRDSRGLVLRP